MHRESEGEMKLEGNGEEIVQGFVPLQAYCEADVEPGNAFKEVNGTIRCAFPNVWLQCGK